MKRLYNVTRISTNDKMCEVHLPYGNCITCPWSCDTEVSVILSINLSKIKNYQIRIMIGVNLRSSSGLMY